MPRKPVVLDFYYEDGLPKGRSYFESYLEKSFSSCGERFERRGRLGTSRVETFEFMSSLYITSVYLMGLTSGSAHAGG